MGIVLRVLISAIIGEVITGVIKKSLVPRNQFSRLSCVDSGLVEKFNGRYNDSESYACRLLAALRVSEKAILIYNL